MISDGPWCTREVGENLGVHPSTVCRTVALFNTTGNVLRQPYPPNSGTAIFTEIDKSIILESALDKPVILFL